MEQLQQQFNAAMAQFNELYQAWQGSAASGDSNMLTQFQLTNNELSIVGQQIVQLIQSKPKGSINTVTFLSTLAPGVYSLRRVLVNELVDVELSLTESPPANFQYVISPLSVKP